MLTQIKKLINSRWHKQVFIYVLYLSYIFLFISFTGVVALAPTYLLTLENIIHYYIAFILIARFNPYFNTGISFDSYDKKIVFSAGCALLLTTSTIHIIR